MSVCAYVRACVDTEDTGVAEMEGDEEKEREGGTSPDSLRGLRSKDL